MDPAKDGFVEEKLLESKLFSSDKFQDGRGKQEGSDLQTAM